MSSQDCRLFFIKEISLVSHRVKTSLTLLFDQWILSLTYYYTPDEGPRPTWPRRQQQRRRQESYRRRQQQQRHLGGGAHKQGRIPAAPLSISSGSPIGIGLAKIGRSPYLQGLSSLDYLRWKSTRTISRGAYNHWNQERIASRLISPSPLPPSCADPLPLSYPSATTLSLRHRPQLPLQP
jgi:hypothetical protein